MFNASAITPSPPHRSDAQSRRNQCLPQVDPTMRAMACVQAVDADKPLLYGSYFLSVEETAVPPQRLGLRHQRVQHRAVPRLVREHPRGRAARLALPVRSVPSSPPSQPAQGWRSRRKCRPGVRFCLYLRERAHHRSLTVRIGIAVRPSLSCRGRRQVFRCGMESGPVSGDWTTIIESTMMMAQLVPRRTTPVRHDAPGRTAVTHCRLPAIHPGLRGTYRRCRGAHPNRVGSRRVG